MVTATAMDMETGIMKTKKAALLLLGGALSILGLQAQDYSPYNNPGFDPLTRELYQAGLKANTSIRPLRMDQLAGSFNTDSLIQRQLRKPEGRLNIWQRFIHDDFIRWEKPGASPIVVTVNPYFNFELGQDRGYERNIWTNTRGGLVDGKLGKNLAFHTALFENQSVQPTYINDFINSRGVVPGQGRAKTFGDEGWDYSQSSGYLSYNAGEWVNLTLAYGKNFIGDGYRSLLLSDNSYSYPHVKMKTTFWNVEYLFMLAQFAHYDDLQRSGDERFPYKYGVFHYLNWNIGSRFSLGLYENVIWAAEDQTGYRGIDLGYVVPVILYRPAEYSVGSPDNVTMGFNLKFIPWKDAALYGQIVLNEFKLDEITSGEKWWANKQGFQVGYKHYNFLGISNLDVQTEYNQVRPFTYAHYSPITNFGHMNQELAHPLGANFRESISFLTYRHRRWHLHLEAMYAIHGKDYYDASRPADEQISWGGDIFVSVNNRFDSHGHVIGQGMETTIQHAAASVSYLINPKNNMNLSVGLRMRKSESDLASEESTLINFAFRTSLRAFYLNF